MPYVVFRGKGRIRGFIEAWRVVVDRVAMGKPLGYGKKTYGVSIRDVIESSTKLVKASSSYSSIPVVSSSRYVDLYRYAKNWASLHKLVSEYRLSPSLCLPSLLAGVAQGYVIVIKTNRLGVARTFLGDYLVNEGLFDQKDLVDRAIAYLIPSLYIPSRTQLMYLLMKSVDSLDPEVLASALRSMLFTGGLMDIEKLALVTYLELDETGFFEKYGAEKNLLTPTYFAYLLAQLLDRIMDFDTFKKTYLYVTRGKGLASTPAFKKLFEKTTVDESVLKELEVKPGGDVMRRVIESIAKSYEKIQREVIGIVRL